MYALCEIDEDNKRIPIYIGKGSGERCLAHLSERGSGAKIAKLKVLRETEKLGIDILAYALDEQTALVVESACIDLLSVENLTNAIRGHGDSTKRTPIKELASLKLRHKVEVRPDHRGVVFLLEKSYRHDFGDLALLEHTRGIWRHKQPESVIYAYATYRGIVKEVYKIYSWVPAGTQEYFTRKLDPDKTLNRWEFVGKKAEEEIRDLYVGKMIWKKRSYGDPVKVGFGDDIPKPGETT